MKAVNRTGTDETEQNLNRTDTNSKMKPNRIEQNEHDNWNRTEPNRKSTIPAFK